MTQVDCLFCKIIDGKIPSEKVFEDSKVIAFKDISPQAPIHYLFVPKEHVENVDKLSPQSTVMADLFAAIQKTAQKEGFAQKGYRTLTNTNEDGGQVVYHLHVHLLAGRKLGSHF